MAPLVDFRISIPHDGCDWVKGSPRGLDTKLVEGTAVVSRVLKRWDRTKTRLSGYYITDEWERDPNADLPVKDWEEWSDQDAAEEPSLFRIFADLRADADALVEFANQWGLLWHVAVSGNTSFLYRAGGEDGHEYRTGHSMAAEAAEHWIAEIIRMRRAVRLWDLIQDRDEGPLATFLEQSRKIDGLGFLELHRHSAASGRRRGISKEIRREFSRIRTSSINPPLDVETLLESGAVLEAGRAELASMVDDSTERAFSLMLWPRDDDAWAISIAPDCLLDFLWLQFANAIAGDIRFQSCAECGSWIEVKAGSSRPDKTYCSDACRMRAYRKRKANHKSSTVSQSADTKKPE